MKRNNPIYLQLTPKGKRIIARVNNVVVTETSYYADPLIYDEPDAVIVEGIYYEEKPEPKQMGKVQRFVKRFFGFK